MTATMTSEVSRFASAVRAALDDLAADDIDDLTDGLEADLAESIAEAGTDAGQLADPVGYAAELRAAAGFAPRIRRGMRLDAAGISEWYRARLEAGTARVNSTPTGERVWGFLVALRPVWWVLRGWAIYEVAIVLVRPGRLSEWVPSNPTLGLILIAMIVLSVQWGRGRWLRGRWMHAAKFTASVVAVATLPFFALTIRPAYDVQYIESASAPVSGLSNDGQPVGNVFAYDQNGVALTGVQLFDQDGRPLTIASDDDARAGYHSYTSTDGVARYTLPSSAVTGRNGWNVYPLREIAEGDVDSSTYPITVDSTKVYTPEAPFSRAQPLATESDAGPSASPGPSASGAPTPSPSPSPSPTDSSSPSPTPSPTDSSSPSPSPSP